MPEISSLKKFWPTTLAGQAMLVGVVVWFINWVFADARTLWGSVWLKTLIDWISVGALLPLAYWIYRGTRWTLERLLWRLRRRLIVTWLLIGVLPLLLLLALMTLLGYVLFTQTHVNLARRQLEVYLAESRAAAEALSQELKANPLNPAGLLQTRAEILEPIFPQIRLGLRPEASLPQWVVEQPEFHGLVVEKVTSGRREVYVYHLVRLNQATRTVLQVKYPVKGLCKNLSGTVGVSVSPGYALLALSGAVQPGGEDLTATELSEFSENGYEGVLVYAPLYHWESGRRMEGEVLRLDASFLRPTQIWQRVQQFRNGSRYGYLVFWVLAPITVIFGVIGSLAVISAAVLTRSITGTVHFLYEGTKKVEAGDLEHEIRAISKDQLGDLAHSFNRMIHSVRDLLRVSAEKQRLDQEMKIAAQVQARLFPRALPPSTLLDFAPGVCLPARQVSGDYYDFLAIAPGLIGVVIADVCGKGVSAALLMANLQAMLRSQVQACHEVQPPLRSVAEIVTQVNRLLAASSPDASFVTLCYAEFDEHTSTLRYTNAGHNPPLIWRGNADVERLDCGGTVVGLFQETSYEQAAVRLYSGDLFVAFTDGLLEARNSRGEEFGEERILPILERHAQQNAETIKQQLLAAVYEWTNGIEQEDDLTLVVFKRL